MPLSPQERGRYARHLLLPEIGLFGQEQLVRARYRVAAEASPLAAEFARTYLNRAGMREGQSQTSERSLEASEEAMLDIPSEQVIREVAGRPELVHAASALVGALCAVEAVKSVLDLGNALPLSLPLPGGEGRGEGLSLSVEDV